MAILPILIWPDARLATRCEPVRDITDQVRQLASDMLETMYAAPGRGLAAPQVGVMLRLFVMDVTWKEGPHAPVVVINPEILEMSPDRDIGAEGCLSIPGATTFVERALWIRMAWTDLDGHRQDEVLSGMAAICAQHEFDHLDGILTLDRLSAEDRARAEAEMVA
jgi:peptide deformylase